MERSPTDLALRLDHSALTHVLELSCYVAAHAVRQAHLMFDFHVRLEFTFSFRHEIALGTRQFWNFVAHLIPMSSQRIFGLEQLVTHCALKLQASPADLAAERFQLSLFRVKLA